MAGISSWVGFLSYSTPAAVRLKLRWQTIKSDVTFVQAITLILVILAIALERSLRRAKPKRFGNTDDGRATSKAHWLNKPIRWGETRLQYMVAVGWLLTLVGLTWWRGSGDYLYFTKAIGHIAFSLMPLQFLIAPKPLPNSNLVMRSSAWIASIGTEPMSGVQIQTLLRPYHRLLGRIVMFPLFVLHATLFLGMFIDFGFDYFLERLEFRHVKLGIAGLFLTILSWLSSASKRNIVTGLRGRVSKHTYRLTHVGGMVLLMLAIYFHVKQARKYALQTLAVYGLDFCSILLQKVGNCASSSGFDKVGISHGTSEEK